MTNHAILDPNDAVFLDGLVATGRFGSTDEALREALRLLHEREARVADLREAWRVGVESGDYEPDDKVLDRLQERYASDARDGD